uniref:BTB/POZ domain-containing protein At3g22104-like n=1 Tax=Erigeron canadensis TaxID=72917 RepID=UPI001CB96DE2|nr:BTB/POZ domain-containing protein At3g22104-like [Erigeron canadensis]
MCNSIQVEINGEHIFFLDKRILATHSNRVRNSIIKHDGKLVFNDFPGGEESFKLITSFCYNNGTIDITPSNIFLLHTSSTFMEITTLIIQTELYLESIHCITWTEFVNGLRQCQMLFPFIKNSPKFKYFLNTLLRNLALPNHLSSSSSCPSSSNSSTFRVSSNSSPESLRSNNQLDYWKLEDLSFLNIDIFEELMKSMIFLHFNHPRICSFIFHYQKLKFSLCCSQDQKCKISETNINLLSLLNGSSFSCRPLLDAFGMCLCLNMKTLEKSKLEKLLGSRLDEFKINDLIVRGKKKVALDVDLILRLVKIFLLERRINGFFMHRVKKVGLLIDLFMLEVAPDPFLKHSKFLALAMALPDYARDSHDRMYHAIDLYVKVHRGLSEEQNKKMWSVLDINKLHTATTGRNVAKNTKLLPFVRQNQFKIFINYDYGAERFSHRKEKTLEDEKRDANIAKKTQKHMSKKLRSLDECSVRSLPRLCH